MSRCRDERGFPYSNGHKDMPADLHTEVGKLRTWLATHRWVDDYDDWWSNGGVVSALQAFLTRVAPQDWRDDDDADLLYILEQCSTGYTAELFGQHEPVLLAIAKHALAHGGVAGDDIAEQLGYCVHHRDEAEALLLAFIGDEHERTRRMALLSLAELGSAQVPRLASAAWDTGEEYPRIAALFALKTIGSALFPIYLQRAREDGREQLASFARKCSDTET